MTPAEQEKVNQIERDRRRREDELLLLLLLLLSTTSTYAIHAIRLGVPPVKAVDSVWLGTGGGFPGAAASLSGVMMKSHLQGMVRGTILTTGSPKPTPNDVPDIYRGIARTMAEQAGQTLRDVVTKAMDMAGGVKDQVAALRQAFKAGGYTEENPFAAQRIATLAVMKSYGLGLYSGYLRADLHGFRHISVVDDVTTEICLERDGLSLPKDDPYWLTGWPPLHWNCRSVVLPVLSAQHWDFAYPTTPPTPGFGVIPQDWLAAIRQQMAA